MSYNPMVARISLAVAQAMRVTDDPELIARSVVEAMREGPTQGVINAHIDCEWPRSHDFPDGETAAAEWEAMLAAAVA